MQHVNIPQDQTTGLNPLSFSHAFTPVIYQNNFPTLPVDHPKYQTVNMLFNRMIAACGIDPYRIKPLIIIENSKPDALSFPDGTVVISTGAIDLCYQNVSSDHGDGRMAFILGHELNHLARNDFWHIAAFHAIQNKHADSNTMSKDRMIKTIVDSYNPLEKEFRADMAGLLTASMAGFNTKGVVNQENLFEQWVNRFQNPADTETYSQNHDTNTHPDPVSRASMVIAFIQSIVSELDMFYCGVRLFEIGKYDDASHFFTAFQSKYPSREVLNNIGISLLKKAKQELKECHDDVPFQLSLILDHATLAEQFRGCQDAQKSIQRAMSLLENAVKQDPDYLPAQINLSTAKIMHKDFHGAINALPHKSHDPLVENQKLICHYYIAKQMGLDFYDQAITGFDQLLSTDPNFSPGRFNLGYLYGLKGDDINAMHQFKLYLKQNPVGLYADFIRKKYHELNNEFDENDKKFFYEPCPIQLGEMNQDTELFLTGFDKHSFTINYMPVDYYHFNDYRVLVLDWNVIYIECPVQTPLSIEQFVIDYGQPYGMFETPIQQTWVYDSFAIDIVNQMIIKVIFF